MGESGETGKVRSCVRSIIRYFTSDPALDYYVKLNLCWVSEVCQLSGGACWVAAQYHN